MGGRGNVLAQAVAYVQIFFGGAILPWLMNSMAGILRGTGNMKLPSALFLNSALCQIILGGTLGLGLGPIPQFGMRGVAAGSLTAYTISISVMGWYMFSGRARVTPKIGGLRLQSAMFFDILKVGAVSCFSPLQSVLTISIFTHMLAAFGTAVLAGYGIGARLEFLLTSLSFSFGIASVPMIGMTIGGGNVARARRIAWTAGSISFVAVGAIRLHHRGLSRSLGQHLHPGRGACRSRAGSICRWWRLYAFLGLASSMYFSSQGAAKMIGPVLAQTARLVFIAPAAGGCRRMARPRRGFFVAAASSMVVLGVLSCSSVVLTRWGPSELRSGGTRASRRSPPAADIGDPHGLVEASHCAPTAAR